MSGNESLLKGKHILAVDDEKDVLATITDILEESVVDWALDYENASKKIKAGKWDLVILDIKVPIIGGRKVFREIRKINPEQKILIMSGYVDLEDLDELIKSGADGLLRKPFSMYKIIGKVQDIIFQ